MEGCEDLSNLENLLKKITEDGNERARAITDDANAKTAAVIEGRLKEASAERDKIIAAAHEEADRSKELIVSGKRLEIRDRIIAAKREIIEKVFNDALNRLNDLPQEQFYDFLLNCLKASELTGDTEILLPEKYNGTNLNSINTALKKAGKNINVRLGTGYPVKSGFVLKTGGVEQNQTFEALLDYQRDVLEAEVMQNLF